MLWTTGKEGVEIAVGSVKPGYYDLYFNDNSYTVKMSKNMSTIIEISSKIRTQMCVQCVHLRVLVRICVYACVLVCVHAQCVQYMCAFAVFSKDGI